MSKPIRLSVHAELRLPARGATTEDVETAIRTAPWQPSEQGRLQCRKDFRFDADWNGKHYRTRQVRPIFVETSEEIVVVTVYVYYF